MSAFSENLVKLRHNRNLSQRTVAQSLNVSQALLSHYEHGVREPKLSFIPQIARFYGVSSDSLLGISSPASGECVGNLKQLLQKTSVRYGELPLKRVEAYINAVLDRVSASVEKPDKPYDAELSVAVSLCEAEYLSELRGFISPGR